MKTTSKVIFWIFVAITVISFIASIILCGDEDESKNARKTAVYSMICGIITTYLSWIFWDL